VAVVSKVVQCGGAVVENWYRFCGFVFFFRNGRGKRVGFGIELQVFSVGRV